MPIAEITNPLFRECMAHFASGVTVITARSSSLGVGGFTATAFSSVSLDPPLVLVCMAKTASAFDVVMAAEHVGINILAESQSSLAEQFARKNIDRFEGVALVDAEGGAPLIKDALVNLACRPHTRIEAGDHIILILEVTAAAVTPGKTLLHYNRQFGGFAPH